MSFTWLQTGEGIESNHEHVISIKLGSGPDVTMVAKKLGPNLE